MLKRHYNELTALINEIICEIQQPTTSMAYSTWDSSDQAIDALQELLVKIKDNDFEALQTLNVLFLPTGVLQDLSISNGWGDKYLKLSSRFDQLRARLVPFLNQI